MVPRKLNLLIVSYGYGGNGGIASMHPDVTKWLIDTIIKAKEDPRLEHVDYIDLADTPITMTRNQSVVLARKTGADLLLMVDSDMGPDPYVGVRPDAVPFYDAAMKFCYDHWDEGPNVVGAPYCGPPAVSENIYVFHWDNRCTEPEGVSECDLKISQYSRSHADIMRGIQPAAALPTGLILFDMRAFELNEPCMLPKVDVLRMVARHEISPEEGVRMLNEGWFYYEWLDNTASEKASTEDVTTTRDISLCGWAKLRRDVVYCAWDSWAIHWKPKPVGRPNSLTPEIVSGRMLRALDRPAWGQRLVNVDFTKHHRNNGRVAG